MTHEEAIKYYNIPKEVIDFWHKKKGVSMELIIAQYAERDAEEIIINHYNKMSVDKLFNDDTSGKV